MGIVLQFPRRSPVVCSEITQEHADEIQDVLSQTLSACPACTGRGVLLFKGPNGLLGYTSCPCGGTDEERIDLSDFGGAA